MEKGRSRYLGRMGANRIRLAGPGFVRQGWAATLVIMTSCPAPIDLLRAAEVYKSVDAEGHVVYSDHLDNSVAQSPVEIGEPNLFSDDDARTSEPPPPLLDDPLPPCPEDGYLWTPGYWSRNAGGFFWVQGDWFPPPRVGVLWTPGYWQYVDAFYIFHRGYWAARVGYYGGINYGAGYFGTAFTGGRWEGGSFAYNVAVYGANARAFHHTYSEPVSTRTGHNPVSYNGGPGGVALAPTTEEKVFAAEAHMHPTPLQRHTLAQAAASPTLMPQATHVFMPPTTHVAEAARVTGGPVTPAVPRALATSTARANAPAALQREVVRAAPSPRVIAPAVTPRSNTVMPRSAAPARMPERPPS